MNSRTLAKTIAAAALEKKAEDVIVLDLHKLGAFTEYFVIASGASDRQVQAIARGIEETLHVKKEKPIGVEGLQAGKWVLIDYGNVVAHVFYTADREYYQLERLWADAPRLKVAGC
jgi:ribosome-associated protein